MAIECRHEDFRELRHRAAGVIRDEQTTVAAASALREMAKALVRAGGYARPGRSARARRPPRGWRPGRLVRARNRIAGRWGTPRASPAVSASPRRPRIPDLLRPGESGRRVDHSTREGDDGESIDVIPWHRPDSAKAWATRATPARVCPTPHHPAKTEPIHGVRPGRSASSPSASSYRSTKLMGTALTFSGWPPGGAGNGDARRTMASACRSRAGSLEERITRTERTAPEPESDI